MLRSHRSALDRLAKRLIDAETIERDELRRMMESESEASTPEETPRVRQLQ